MPKPHELFLIMFLFSEFKMEESQSLSAHDFAVYKLQDTCKSILRDFGFTSVAQSANSKLAALLRSKINEYAHSTRAFMELGGEFFLLSKYYANFQLFSSGSHKTGHK